MKIKLLITVIKSVLIKYLFFVYVDLAIINYFNTTYCIKWVV